MHTSASGCAKSGHSQTCFASHTFNTEYYSTIICMHILVYIYKDSTFLEKFKMYCRLNIKQNKHLPCLIRCQVAVQKAAPLNTSAFTSVILNIKLQNLHNLYSYWTFKYQSLYNSVKSAGGQGEASWQMSVAVHKHSLTWVLQVIHLQCFILNFKNLGTDNSVSCKHFWAFM
jgi:hypothetical protein